MITYKKSSTKSELEQILKLQKINLYQNLSEKERVEQGFVTVEHSFEILKKMNDKCEHTIAICDNKVIGFALSMTLDFANDIPVLKPMFNEMSSIISDENYIVMGQICIDKNYRGKGVFKGLYQFMKTDVCANGQFKLIVTEIDVKNSRSLNAHQSVGFIKLKDYNFENKMWRIVSLEV
ncbi:GNAT family N-acetyltransferase [uncultured Polaribacter sp.]|uniref:GNAT family N-acetyltransferase n=1 Tax=uncultured Polaribacter sp. TaxID=174711 RepID=UPI00262090D8|nr:GNAT family N-acetyltransferase [uncultured Polaribacter sp.]